MVEKAQTIGEENSMSASQNVIAAFSEDQTARLTRITKSQLRYWDKTDFYKPSYAEENRRIAFSRVYSFKDIVALRVLNVLRNQYGVSLSHLRQVSERLSHLEADPDRWTHSILYVVNKRVHWIEPDTQLPQEIVSRQYVVPTITLEQVILETKRDTAKGMASRDQSKIGSIERHRYVNHNTPVLGGTRIPVNAIKRYSKAGYTTEQIVSEYPDLTAKDVEAALEYESASSAA